MLFIICLAKKCPPWYQFGLKHPTEDTSDRFTASAPSTPGPAPALHPIAMSRNNVFMPFWEVLCSCPCLPLTNVVAPELKWVPRHMRPAAHSPVIVRMGQMIRTNFLTGINELNLLTSYGPALAFSGPSAWSTVGPIYSKGIVENTGMFLTHFLVPPTEVPLFFWINFYPWPTLKMSLMCT